jgi:plasmid stabilization system protein ParE
MPRGDKTKYTDKQVRKADHIAESYESRGVPEDEAKRRAWATVNNESGGGKKRGSHSPMATTRDRVKLLAELHQAVASYISEAQE